jgi:hypothetical protein
VYNKDESVIRQLIVGLLADLNQKIFYYNQLDEDTRVKVDIPFMFHITGDESFLQQHFFNDLVRDPEGEHAKTNYEKLPRGIIELTGMQVDSASLLNKYVYGTYNRLVGQEMKSFHSQFQMIPVSMTFDVSVKVDNQLDIFKVAEALIKRLYKNNAFNVEAGHPSEATFRCACYYKMPEDYTKERPVEFSLDDDKRYQVTFSLDFISFIPSFDFTHEQFAGNRMFNISQNTFVVPKRMDKEGDNHYGDRPPSGKLDEKEEEVRKDRQDSSFDEKHGEDN